MTFLDAPPRSGGTQSIASTEWRDTIWQVTLGQYGTVQEGLAIGQGQNVLCRDTGDFGQRLTRQKGLMGSDQDIGKTEQSRQIVIQENLP